ncbi:MAG: hypothetical protein WKG06_43525 [Segetibacter sp.]
MYVVGALNISQYHIRIAENYEKEGDDMVNNRKSNTYYPTIAEVYRNGLREVKSVADCDNLKDRLQEKITREAKEHSAMIQSFGVAMTPPIDYEDIKKQVSDLGVNDFESGYKGLFLIPIVLDDTINKLVDDSKSFRSPMMNLLSQIEKIDDKGAKVGFTRGDDALINNARRFCRERTIALIKSIKHVMDIHKKTDRDFIFALIQNLNSRFIPDDRKYIYAEGIYRGFNNDYISAAHLLLPQFENSFRYIASQNGINTTKWTEELRTSECLWWELGENERFIKR